MLDNLIPIMRALENGEKAQARRLLRPLLEQPTADLWYLASQASEKTAHEIDCLERALALDPLHGKAKVRLLALRDRRNHAPPSAENVATVAPGESRPRRFTSKPLPDENLSPARPATPVTPKDRPLTRKPLTEADLPPLKKVRNPRRKGSVLWRVGCLSGVLVSLLSSYFLLMLFGSGLPAQFRALVGQGDAPVLSNQDNAVYVIDASKSQFIVLDEIVTDILEPGYVHEFQFDARRGQDMAVVIQFMSPSAQRVKRNVTLLNALGQDVGGICRAEQVLSGDTGMAYACQVPVSERWTLRVYGRDGESTGVYFVTISAI